MLKLHEEFINKARAVHGDRYDYTLVNYVNSHTKIIILCKIHGKFIQQPNNHLNGCGCCKCGIISSKRCRLTDKFFVEKARIKHKNKYDYSLSKYIASNIKLKIICPEHGEWSQTPSNHLRGAGCPKCKIQDQKLSYKEFVEKANKIHNNKYTYDHGMVNNCKSNIKITCDLHGLFKQTIGTHLRGSGCPRCGKISHDIKISMTQEEFIKKANKIHHDEYDYSLTRYIKGDKKINILCKKHGLFIKRANSHLRGEGCQKCIENKVSRLETLWLDSLNIENRQYCIKIDNKKFIVDGYDPRSNTIYEFNGDFWHGNPSVYNLNDVNSVVNKTFGYLYDKTIKRENTLKSAGYNVIIKWETDIKTEK